MTDLTSYTAAEARRIELQACMIEASICPMAVVDYFGRVDGDGRVTAAQSDLFRRFGTRDMRHVGIYGLKVVHRNQAARKAAA